LIPKASDFFCFFIKSLELKASGKLPVNRYDETEYPDKKRKFMLPWWFKIVLYVVSFFIASKGISLGNNKTTEWLISVLASLFSSLFLTQPLQVFFTTFVLVALFRSYDDSSDTECDVTDTGGPIHKVNKHLRTNIIYQLESTKVLLI